MINPRTLRIVLTVAAFFLPWLVALAALLGLPPEWADTIKKSLSIPEFYYTASLSFVVIVIFGVLIFILNEKIHDKVSELETLRKEHQARLAELDQKHADEISAAEHNYAAQTRQLIERADAQSKSLVERYEDEIRTLNAEHDLEVKTLIEEKNRAELRVAEEDAAHRYDIVTKIPNMQSWAVDVPNYCSLMVQKNIKFQIIMLDLVKFGELNKKVGHYVADKVIEAIGQYLTGTIRRSERVYKEGVVDVYRSYNRGDEFLFIVEGEQWDAVGLLNRLQTTKSEIQDQIRRKCAQIDPKLDVSYPFEFRAGIVPLERSDSAERAFENAAGALQKAVEADKAIGMRLYWYPETDIDTIEEHWKRAIYANALDRFSSKRAPA